MAPARDSIEAEVSCHRPIPLCPNPLDTFPRIFPADGEVVNLLRTCYGERIVDCGLWNLDHKTS